MAFNKQNTSCCVHIFNMLSTGALDAKEADELLAALEHKEEME